MPDQDKADCEVCGASDRLTVVASSFGPVSFAYCSSCAERCAEPLMVVATCIWVVGGPSSDLSDLEDVTTFADGRYVGLDAVVSRYDDKLEQQIKAEFFG